MIARRMGRAGHQVSDGVGARGVARRCLLSLVVLHFSCIPRSSSSSSSSGCLLRRFSRARRVPLAPFPLRSPPSPGLPRVFLARRSPPSPGLPRVFLACRASSSPAARLPRTPSLPHMRRWDVHYSRCRSCFASCPRAGLGTGCEDGR